MSDTEKRGRGRPPIDGGARDTSVRVRLREVELGQVVAIAEREGVTVAEWCRGAIMRAARRGGKRDRSG